MVLLSWKVGLVEESIGEGWVLIMCSVVLVRLVML